MLYLFYSGSDVCFFQCFWCIQWFEKYPEFVANPFFISGESYAGVYVPTLASEVVKGISFVFFRFTMLLSFMKPISCVYLFLSSLLLVLLSFFFNLFFFWYIARN